MKTEINYHLHASVNKDWARVRVRYVEAASVINSRDRYFTYSHCGRKFRNQRISSIISEIRVQEVR
jgi:hypothetical protein